MKVVAFAASSSKNSINKKLVTYAASLLKDADIEVLDLNDYELPLFSVDKEQALGQPDLANAFLNKIAEADALIISFAEHNGNYTVAYKNLFDWCSRINRHVFQGKPLVLLATSVGAGGANTVLTMAKNSMPHFGGDVKASVSVPNFNEHFDIDSGHIHNKEINTQLLDAIELLR